MEDFIQSDEFSDKIAAYEAELENRVNNLETL